jgi:RNA polymerase sigma-70 factor (ECF subfamily)
VWGELSDAEVTALAQQGSLAAFDELVRRFRPAVRSTARRYTDDPEAGEDLCQEAFLRAFKALRQLDRPARFGAWLHAITRNLALHQLRNGARRGEHVSLLDLLLLEGLEAASPSPFDAALRGEADRAVRRAVDTLPLPYREVVLLHYWEGMPLSRVAAYMDIPLTTAKWRLRHARDRLRTELRQHDELFEEKMDDERAADNPH